MAKELSNGPLIQSFARALGVGDPNDIRRIVVDINSGHAVIIHVEYYAESDVLIDVTRHLEGVKVTYAQSNITTGG